MKEKTHAGFCKYSNVSDLPRSLQSWVSTIQTVVLTAHVFQLFTKYTRAAIEMKKDEDCEEIR